VLINVRESHVAESGLRDADEVQVDSTAAGGRARWASTYSDLGPGEWGVITDPRGWLLVIRGNPANAAEALGSVGSGDPIWLTAPRG
jgi:hypothetical protein